LADALYKKERLLSAIEADQDNDAA